MSIDHSIGKRPLSANQLSSLPDGDGSQLDGGSEAHVVRTLVDTGTGDVTRVLSDGALQVHSNAAVDVTGLTSAFHALQSRHAALQTAHAELQDQHTALISEHDKLKAVHAETIAV